MEEIKFLDANGTFSLQNPENYSYLYFPIAGEGGIKSSVTPDFGGDCKLNQNAFIMEPVSAENLHNNRSGRNFWCEIKGSGCWSAVGRSAEAEASRFTERQEESELVAGFMEQSVARRSNEYGISAKVTSFVPLQHNVEIMYVEITNEGKDPMDITPVAAIPIYGRSADNIRDHRHVTSLLHRIRTTKNGIYVRPALSFDERGHQKNRLTYFVCGVTGEGEKPLAFYPIVEQFLGEGGTYTHPRAVFERMEGVPAGISYEGKETVGGIRFADITLEPGARASYTLLIGVTEEEDSIPQIVEDFRQREQVLDAKEKMQAYWQEQVNVRCDTGNLRFDNLMRWVSFQPFLRRIYGCSFLPHHDYGKGGRGWRDLWQDCLALLIMNPSGVRRMILDNFGGVRLDGTNATIIGSGQGEFIADRNNISRVWMDHGVWPFMTTRLYMDQTGDVEILNQKIPYFKDKQVGRGTAIDRNWSESYGRQQKDQSGEVYRGSVLEHLLLQNLCAFYEVGDHNEIRLRGADWNDAIDMAKERGESVAFTAAYAGNLKDIAGYLRLLKERTGQQTVDLLVEMTTLLGGDEILYEDITKKRAVLADYTAACRHNNSGKTIAADIEELAKNLEDKAEWMMERIRFHEWVTDGEGNGWFNSYYDNHGNPVEGRFENGVRMMLTGQVFAIMSGTAREEQIRSIAASADKYLYDEGAGGYRLNTDFKEEKYDMGRMFGFAYGEKENGAVFSHMTVMYANALYRRGFVQEGYRALQTLADTALDFKTSRIYPGIPEYFNAQGRGMYNYLTGAASWYMLTLVTEVFGVRGEEGNLVLEPKLVAQQFDSEGWAKLKLVFAEKRLLIRYYNPQHKEYGDYRITKATLDDRELCLTEDGRIVIDRAAIAALKDEEHDIMIELM